MKKSLWWLAVCSISVSVRSKLAHPGGERGEATIEPELQWRHEIAEGLANVLLAADVYLSSDNGAPIGEAEHSGRNLRLGLVGNRNVTVNLTSLVVLGLGVAAAVSFFSFFDNQQAAMTAATAASGNFRKRSLPDAFPVGQFTGHPLWGASVWAKEDGDANISSLEEDDKSDQSDDEDSGSAPTKCTQVGSKIKDQIIRNRKTNRFKNTLRAPAWTGLLTRTESSNFDHLKSNVF